MPSPIDATHNPELQSWVSDANGHANFPIQNLPLGIFRPGNEIARAGIAIGDHILSLSALGRSGLLSGDAQIACNAVESHTTLNSLLSLGAPCRVALRSAVSRLLAKGNDVREELLYPAADCELMMPAQVGDYTDFYAGIHHAKNIGKLIRPDDPLLPNYKWVPIGYNGRCSSLRTSGVPVRRPRGQRRLPDETVPTFGATAELDFELELGIWIGPGNTLGEIIAIESAEQSIAGYCLLNDWSARDIQFWEYKPLGPFLAKSFHTTLSGWIITPEALAPFRGPQLPRATEDPLPLPYLFSTVDQQAGALNVELEALLLTRMMRDRKMLPHRLAKSHASNLYWTPSQLVAHHASNGCSLYPGDLLGTGTISSPEADGLGSLMELTKGGQETLTLMSGEQRQFLEDGDEIILRAKASCEGYVSIGFGDCSATILPAKE